MSDYEKTETLTVNLLFRELRDVKLEWDAIGMHLELRMSEIKEIERDHQTTARRMMEMLEKWINKEKSPSWEPIIAALESMDKANLASQLRQKYLHQPEKAASRMQAASETVLKVDMKDPVVKEVESLKENHLLLVKSAESALKDVNPLPEELKRFCQEYIVDRKVTTVDGLFDCLGDFNFLNYTLLRYIINHFLKEAKPIVSRLDDYVQQLNKFKSSTTLREFMESIQNAQKLKEGTELCTVTLRLVGGWIEKTMKDLESLLKEIFQDKSWILAHLKITIGSVIVTYLAPLSEVRSLIDLAQTKLPFMRQVGVCSLTVGDMMVYEQLNRAERFLFETSLSKAVVDNDISLITFLLNLNTNPDVDTDTKGYTSLAYVIYFNRKETVRLLLQANANPNYQPENGSTPLYIAAERGHSNIVKILLQHNANPNLQILCNASTPLFMATQEGHADIVAILLKAKANPNIPRNDGSTPLHIAASKGHSEIVDMLLEANASPNTLNHNGKTPLYYAAMKGHLSAVEIFLHANADPDCHGDVTPLCIAASNGHVNVVAYLLQNKANPNLLSATGFGITPLLIASQKGYFNTVHMLLGAYANPNIQTSDYNVTPLHQAAQNGSIDIVRILLQANANPNLRRVDGVTPLYIAAQEGQSEIVTVLLGANANPSLESNDASTPLYIAAQNGYSDIVSDLLRAKSSLNLQCKINGSTPLYTASQEGHSDIVRILLQANADPNIQRDDGATPIFIASQNGYSAIVQLLLEAKADPNIHLENGSTPVMCATIKCFPHIVHLLLTNGADPNKKIKLRPTLTNVTALMLASRLGCLECTKLLLKFEADPSIADSQGLTAFDIAGFSDNTDLIRAALLKSSNTSHVAVTTSISHSPVVTPSTSSCIFPHIDNKTISENILVEKVKSAISTQYEYEKYLEKTVDLSKEPTIFFKQADSAIKN